MGEVPRYNPMEEPPKAERSETAKEVPFTALNPGDRVDVQTQNSRYQFEIYLDPQSGRKGLRETSGTGKLAGTEGIPAFDSAITVGQPVRYAEPTGAQLWQTSSVVDFQVQRNIKNAIRSDQMTASDQASLAELRRRLGGRS